MKIEGVVVEGRRLGRELGFPTANVAVDGVEIERGVYLSKVVVEGVEYRAVTNVGTNPTVGEVVRRSESYILGFEGDLYGKTICVELIEKLRDERKFESVEALREQIERDIELANERVIE